MANSKAEIFNGFIIHSYTDNLKDRLYCLGRLADGRSFAAIEEEWRPYIHVLEKDFPRVRQLLAGFDFTETDAMDSFSGREKLHCLKFKRYGSRSRAAASLRDAGIPSPDAETKPADLYLTEKLIRGPVNIKGFTQQGKRVNVIIRKPEIAPPMEFSAVPLTVASVDIETDVSTGVIRAVSIAWTKTRQNEIADNEIYGKVRVLNSVEFVVCSVELKNRDTIIYHNDEKSLLSAFIDDIHGIDPDILTGWNFLDFDFPHLAERYRILRLPFTLGRSPDNAKFFPGDDDGENFRRGRSSSAIVPGRQVLDALRVMRAGVQARSAAMSFALDDIAQQLLGEGKLLHETGDEKIAALDRLYAENPALFGEYCLRDAQLVLKILAKTGLFRLTMERSSLTGVTLDRAWTSVVSFERIYAIELRRRGIAPPAYTDGADVTGAAGGTVLESEPGLYKNVAVFDFRSLYPTIMRTFNIDPLSHARADIYAGKPIVAPNRAAFSREPGLLPSLIAEYFATRRIAIEKGDAIAAQVYKILMNSFYGVLGTDACRYGKSSLAGAITSFARKWLLFSRGWFNSRHLHRSMRVLYGDTDSLFVQTSLEDNTPLAECEKYCASLANEINSLITKTVKKDYDLESFLELRFEKLYRRFLIPPVRNVHHADDGGESRGRAKGYGGYLLHPDGSLTVEVVGMEAVRSDTTPLARRLQLELLELVFSGCTEEEFRQKINKTVNDLQSGELDSELVYRKRLRRYPESYTSSTPPHVKAARALGWKKRRGTVEYLWTVNGPEPVSIPHGKPDYNHYIESQIYPLVRSIAAAAYWDVSRYVMRKPGKPASAQMELEFVE